MLVYLNAMECTIQQSIFFKERNFSKEEFIHLLTFIFFMSEIFLFKMCCYNTYMFSDHLNEILINIIGREK